MIKKALTLLTACIFALVFIYYPVSAAALRLYVTEYGKCKVTAYSGTNGVTYGYSENILVPNESCAASRNIPIGTRLYIEDFGIVTVEDRMSEEYDSDNDGMVVDLYLESYTAACEWGMHELTVYVINEIEIDSERR